MSWFKKLKQFIKVTFRIEIKDSFNFNIGGKAGSSNAIDVDDRSKTVQINLPNLNPGQKNVIQQILQEAVDQGQPLLEILLLPLVKLIMEIVLLFLHLIMITFIQMVICLILKCVLGKNSLYKVM